MNADRFIYHNPEHYKHKGWTDDDGQPWDVPERLYGIVSELLSSNTSTEWFVIPEIHKETLEIISKVHAQDMIKAIHDASERATEDSPLKSAFDRDTMTEASAIYPNTFEQALYSAEVTLAAADALLNDDTKKMTIALSRPPGHHAGRDFYHGFCYFNNAAIAAQAFKDTGKRAAILDIDVHHGDGTQDIVEGDEDTLYVSLHADPDEIFPNTGYTSETGIGEGKGTVLNLPFPIGVSNREYFKRLKTAEERIKSFRPDYLIVDAGFDGHTAEFPDLPPLTHLGDAEYSRIGNKIGRLGLRTLVIMEGGYNHSVTPKAFAAFINGFESGANLDDGKDLYTSDSVLP